MLPITRDKLLCILQQKYNCTEIVKLLLEHGACANVIDHKRQTALHFAAKYNCTEIVKLLLEHGACANVTDHKKQTALHFAAKYNCTEIVKLLLEHGASTNVTDHKKQTPLHIAVKQGNSHIITVLIEHSTQKTNVLISINKLFLTLPDKKYRHRFIEIVTNKLIEHTNGTHSKLDIIINCYNEILKNHSNYQRHKTFFQLILKKLKDSILAEVQTSPHIFSNQKSEIVKIVTDERNRGPQFFITTSFKTFRSILAKKAEDFVLPSPTSSGLSDDRNTKVLSP